MEIQRIYFIGIGGIGMSALARYFLHEGREVAGYDRTRSALTEALAAEGAAIHYTDDTAGRRCYWVCQRSLSSSSDTPRISHPDY